MFISNRLFSYTGNLVFISAVFFSSHSFAQRTSSYVNIRWIHSFEEDEKNVRYYRTSDFAFPPARARDAWELFPEGNFNMYSSGPDDKIILTSGRWKKKCRKIVFKAHTGKKRRLTFKIIYQESNLLKLFIK